MSVDLPAPFSPMSECTSPGNMRKSTPSSAFTPGKRDRDVAHLDDRRGGGCLGHESLHRGCGGIRSVRCRGSSVGHGGCAAWTPHTRRVRAGGCRGIRPLGTQYWRSGRASIACSWSKVVSSVMMRCSTVPPSFRVLMMSTSCVAEQRRALHDEVDLAVGERLHAVLHRVDRDDLDVLARHEAGRLDRLDRAEAHVVVVRVDEVDVGVRLQHRLHDLLAARTGEVAGLARDDLEVRVLADHVGEALGAVDRRSGARRALELHDVDLLGRVLVLVEHPEAGLLALLDEVGAEERDVQRRVLAVDGAVGQHHGDAGGLGLVEHRVPAGLDDGREGDVVDALLDVGADRLDLVLLLLLRVGELELDARLLERGLDVLGVGGAPARLGADLGEADDEFVDGPWGPRLRRRRRRRRSRNRRVRASMAPAAASPMSFFISVNLLVQWCRRSVTCCVPGAPGGQFVLTALGC